MSHQKFVVDAEVSAGVDKAWYLERYPDVAAAGLEPAEHYIRYGARMERDPNPDFSTIDYLKSYPDVAAKGLNPLVHYVRWGRSEGRSAKESRLKHVRFGSKLSLGTDSTPGQIRDAGHVVLKKTGTSPTAKSTPKVDLLQYVPNDLMRKLWGGFARYAEQDLVALFETDLPAARKAAVAWELARFHAAEGHWPESLDFLRRVRKYDRKLLNQKRGRLLEIEGCIATQQFEKAHGLVNYPLENGQEDGDFFCARSNIYVAEVLAGKREIVDAAPKRLAAINAIYKRAGMAPLELLDPTLGVVFGNLRAPKLPADPRSSQAKISILMPVYGAEEFIRSAVGSILNQTWKNIEVVLVEDCGPDNSWDIIQELARNDDRIKCARNERNLGAYPTRNRAMNMATGDFVTVHDSDDWSHPQMLAVQINAMMANPALKVTFTGMTRVSPDMVFSLRPERNNMEYIHRSYPSLMIRRSDLSELDQWDRIAANADDELVQRARDLWGKQALLDVQPNVPFSFFLKHPASLTSQKGTHLRSLTYGVRHEYSKQAEFWRANVYRPMKERGLPVSMARTSAKSPFPIPSNLAPKDWERNTHYDLVIISDLTLLGGTRRCNEGYVQAARQLGMRVGLFHWPRYDLRLLDDIAKEYRFLSYDQGVDILTVEEEVTCNHVIIHHPPILKFVPDAVPTIRANTLDILVNQLPRQVQSEADKYYVREQVEKDCEALFGLKPTWVPISPLVRRFLTDGGYTSLSEFDWIPPLGRHLIEADVVYRTPVPTRSPVIGRHSRDHWTKWPENTEALCNAYCANSAYKVRFMGGTTAPRKMLGKWPSNWEDLQFDSVSVPEFLSSLDFFLHFTHSDYIEEFGRNVMEAMATGVPVIVPPRFEEVFGHAAVYAEPDQVAELIDSLWHDAEAYSALVRRGFDYVRTHAGNETVQKRLVSAVRHGRS